MSIEGPLGAFSPTPAPMLIVCLLMVTVAGVFVIVPVMTLAWPAFGRTPALVASSVLRNARFTVVSLFLRPSVNVAGPSGDVKTRLARFGFFERFTDSSLHL